jgi:chemotaxis protein CheD
MLQADNNSHYLLPGSLFAHRESHVVTTVLGSCVSVCLWDPVRKIGGINHYMLPFWNGEGLASPKYGNIAIAKLIERMLDLGCDKRSLKAKVFGGSAMFRVTSALMNIGERNIILAQDSLSDENIPIIASDLGGKTGRKLIYDTGTGGVSMKRLARQIDDIKI